MSDSVDHQQRPRVGVFVDAENMPLGAVVQTFRLLSELRASVVCFRVYAQQIGQRTGADTARRWEPWTWLASHLRPHPIARVMRARLLQPVGIANAVDTALSQEALRIAVLHRLDRVVICGGDRDYARPIEELLMRRVVVHWLMRACHVQACQRELERMHLPAPPSAALPSIHACDAEELRSEICKARSASFMELVTHLLAQHGSPISIDLIRQSARVAQPWDLRRDFSDVWDMVQHCIRAGAPWQRVNRMIHADYAASQAVESTSRSERPSAPQQPATIQDIVAALLQTPPSDADGWRSWRDVLVTINLRLLKTRRALVRLRRHRGAHTCLAFRGDSSCPDILVLSPDRLQRTLSADPSTGPDGLTDTRRQGRRISIASIDDQSLLQAIQNTRAADGSGMGWRRWIDVEKELNLLGFDARGWIRLCSNRPRLASELQVDRTTRKIRMIQAM